ncbi:hypothetical protein Kpol_1045p25 [Vanderwaltozyma polyspora DSM 70294]|uniref:Uncharacterized protein n=1 Tax=Vanderwaltozyma polyspora (strain ATCC 22028 / DSM 70294 / BCRC 21397 / CBS 2163 / NBRC 10782 / NRRL Y-8283 / UCD 57-17) TaxID=436907 RepID=A7TI32_VANPO|nr:uncharacterized protein Kpol_1045p25 [Vanderwaltozyma polyspora DSM 70294]EDO18039.1 hypothetical protein Kpol_1045p25 [Vanderwaltozyma polyspora DSM 70294]
MNINFFANSEPSRLTCNQLEVPLLNSYKAQGTPDNIWQPYLSENESIRNAQQCIANNGTKRSTPRKVKTRKILLAPLSRRQEHFLYSYKKTHIWRFKYQRKKSKPPLLMFPASAYSNTIRFGAYSGSIDNRAMGCPLRGVKHGLFLKPGQNCPCQRLTYLSSPLCSMLKVP